MTALLWSFEKGAPILLLTVLVGLTACTSREITIAPVTVTTPKRDDWATDLPKWYEETHSYRPIGEGNVARERVVTIPAPTRHRAIQMLKDVPIRALDERGLAEVFLDGAPVANALVQQAVERFEEQRARRDRESRLDAFKSDPRFSEWAAEWQAAAARESELAGRLTPYLVRAVLVNEFTGGFTAWIHDDELWMAHGSLGEGVDHKAPVVVFLDRAPKVIYVTASSAL